MTNPSDPLALAQALIRAASVTPAGPAVFDVLEAALGEIGFRVDRFIAGEAPDGPVENLIAVRGSGSAGAGQHLAFAGHLDVVPPGEGWTASPWSGEVRGAMLYGRGAVDMQRSEACMLTGHIVTPAVFPRA